jgi:hypothetical protein
MRLPKLLLKMGFRYVVVTPANKLGCKCQQSKHKSSRGQADASCVVRAVSASIGDTKPMSKKAQTVKTHKLKLPIVQAQSV